MHTSPMPAMHTTAAARLRRVGRLFMTAQPMKGTRMQYTVVRNALVPGVVFCRPSV